MPLFMTLGTTIETRAIHAVARVRDIASMREARAAATLDPALRDFRVEGNVLARRREQVVGLLGKGRRQIDVAHIREQCTTGASTRRRRSGPVLMAGGTVGTGVSELGGRRGATSAGARLHAILLVARFVGWSLGLDAASRTVAGTMACLQTTTPCSLVGRKAGVGNAGMGNAGMSLLGVLGIGGVHGGDGLLALLHRHRSVTCPGRRQL